MKPVPPREGEPDVVMKGRQGIGDLPVRRGDGCWLSEWDLSFAERQAIAEGARVLLYVMYPGHPPVALEVEGVVE